jgi:hypothetical protein
VRDVACLCFQQSGFRADRYGFGGRADFQRQIERQYLAGGHG